MIYFFTIDDDIKYFRKITTEKYVKDQKNIVIMGYNTYKSIPDNFKPLNDRINIVISINHYDEFKNNVSEILVFKTFFECYKFLENEENKGNMLGEKFIIGGAKLYNHVFSEYALKINKIYETIVKYNILNTKQTHYVNYVDTNELYPELDFNVETYSNRFTCINKKYCDDTKVIVKINNETLHGVEYKIYQNKDYVNIDEKQYLDLMKNIMFKNNVKDSRNSVVISQFGEKMTFDLRKGFPLLTTKRMPFKTILESYYGLLMVVLIMIN